eukprot:4560764-Amphidinium_carterae.1
MHGGASDIPSARHVDAPHVMRAPSLTRQCAHNDPEASQQSGHWKAPVPLVNASEDVMCVRMFIKKDNAWKRGRVFLIWTLLLRMLDQKLPSDHLQMDVQMCRQVGGVDEQ